MRSRQAGATITRAYAKHRNVAMVTPKPFYHFTDSKCEVSSADPRAVDSPADKAAACSSPV
ncbi:hypothetical protein INR49_029936 [Caranx melampygus]|nr:hypothetical protein INR49_029936 [Caranx melampygus]